MFYHSTITAEDQGHPIEIAKTFSNTLVPKGTSQNEHAEHIISLDYYGRVNNAAASTKAGVTTTLSKPFILNSQSNQKSCSLIAAVPN